MPHRYTVSLLKLPVCLCPGILVTLPSQTVDRRKPPDGTHTPKGEEFLVYLLPIRESWIFAAEEYGMEIGTVLVKASGGIKTVTSAIIS